MSSTPGVPSPGQLGSATMNSSGNRQATSSQPNSQVFSNKDNFFDF